ncbi:CMRF35-like molecule 1 [Tachyglossus aculeatus]|uniref:CMRF35-like molecule 1 n=1 Tax=Tachyglossus aculeatus TaxID=9261 RepID=UPI0018F616CB|nr:CMRF35-like molecule 1 [Tachyglossus aculeatus]
MLLVRALLLLWLPGCFTLTDSPEVRSPGRVSGPIGGSLTVRCGYDCGWKTDVKWWCRGAKWNSCRIMVKTTGSEDEQTSDRVSIKDSHRGCTITVIMDNLRAEDADIYWCGIEKAGTDLGAHVVMTINKDVSPPRGPEDVRVPVGGSLTVTCQYDPGWERNGKWWCRGANWRSSNIIVRTPGSKRNNEQMSIRDSPEKRAFTVTMDNVTERDADTYWCGIARAGDDFGARVRLDTFTDISSPKAVNGIEGQSLTVQCRYEQHYRANEKSWCRGAPWGNCQPVVSTGDHKNKGRNGKVSISDCPDNGTFMVTMENLSTSDTDTYWCRIGAEKVVLGFPVTVDVSRATTTMTTVTNPEMQSATNSSQKSQVSQNNSSAGFDLSRLELLLPLVFGVLLVVLVGVSILAWRMVRRQREASGKSATPSPTDEGLELPTTEVCYADLSIHHWINDDTGRTTGTPAPLARPRSAHQFVEYATLGSAKTEDVTCVTYSTVRRPRPAENPIYGNVELPCSPRRNNRKEAK